MTKNKARQWVEKDYAHMNEGMKQELTRAFMAGYQTKEKEYVKGDN